MAAPSCTVGPFAAHKKAGAQGYRAADQFDYGDFPVQAHFDTLEGGSHLWDARAGCFGCDALDEQAGNGAADKSKKRQGPDRGCILRRD